ncbi:MAG: 4Fe-4S ferredoxin, partial [Gammaproteobacteria bacterium]
GTFRVMANGDTHEATRVLLAIGRRGTPRKLGVPGEELPKVVYRLVDPEQYAGRRVLVVGGGDSALEAATSLAEAGAAAVTLSYRGDAFDRAKAQNRARVAEAARSGRLQVRLQSQVREVTSECVTLEQAGQADEIPNDAVVVCAGGVLPNEFLRSIGVSVETHYGAAPGSP